MGTDIYGGIEYRHPGAGTDWYEDQPWLPAVNLWPLYDERDYQAFACLFGVRNYVGFRPLAEGRGLPHDVCSQLRTDLQGMLSLTWVTWAELEAMDLAAVPSRYVGRLRWQDAEHLEVTRKAVVRASWQPELINQLGHPPAGWNPAIDRMDWDDGGRHVEYQRLTVGAVLGADTHWPHVFSVMRALSGRFGDDGVRLVVGFD